MRDAEQEGRRRKDGRREGRKRRKEGRNVGYARVVT